MIARIDQNFVERFYYAHSNYKYLQNVIDDIVI